MKHLRGGSVRRSEAVMVRRVGDEIVILDVNSGQYFGLNEVGAFVWDLLESESDRDAIVAALTAAYDVDAAQAAADVDDLLRDLAARDLIEQ